jgi:two-component system OmpR family response regulator
VSLEEAKTALETQFTPDIVLLDRMLKGEDGASLIPHLKQKYPTCHILVLSAIGTAEEKANIIDQGADDYISKPFSLSELTARLRALKRRPQSQGLSYLLTFKDVLVDLRSQTAHCKNVKIDFSKKEFLVLVTLLQSPGRVYNKFQLLDKVWDVQSDIESNVVEVTLKNIRKKLKESNSEIEILSKRNIGYWIEN